ncbi:MAG: acyl-CoA dehydrogenase family protein [Pigmentiphaga sp.]
MTDAMALRSEVRGFLQEERASGGFTPGIDAWLKSHSPEFSRKLGERGWLGMTWPRHLGGRLATFMERFVVNEELVAAGAPVAAHWVAENQCGPLLLQLGTIEQQELLLPPIARGELYVAAGLSEPDSGSDLASIRTRATRVEGGWRLTGRKIWSSNAHRNQYLLALVRTSPRSEDRHAGLSQMFVDLQAPGVEVRPIPAMGDPAPFAEVALDDVFVPDLMVLGEPGSGWRQVTSMLIQERSGPERYLSTFALLREVANLAAHSSRAKEELGTITARLWAVRSLALHVLQLLDRGQSPALQGAMVKAQAAGVERDIADVARNVLVERRQPLARPLKKMLDTALLASPGFTIRGGSVQILRNVIAKELCKQ